MKKRKYSLKNMLLENESHFNKIADLILSEKIENIHQALELAEGMGYIDGYTYKLSLIHI